MVKFKFKKPFPQFRLVRAKFDGMNAACGRITPTVERRVYKDDPKLIYSQIQTFAGAFFSTA